MAGRQGAHRSATPRRVVAARLTAGALALAWVVASVSGTGGTYAAWSSSITIPGATLQTGTAALQISGFDEITPLFTTGSTPATGTFTVKNTGTAPLTSFSSQTSAAGAAAGSIDLAIWAQPANGVCGTAPANTTAPWSTPRPWLSGTLDASSSATYCVAMSMAPTAVTQYPGATVTATISATGYTGAGNSGWSTGSISQSTALTVAALNDGITNDAGSNITVDKTTSGGQICYAIHVTASSSDQWSVTVPLDVAPFNIRASTDWQWSGDTLGTTAVSDPPSLVITGDPHDNGKGKSGDIVVDQYNPVDFTFCISEEQ